MTKEPAAGAKPTAESLLGEDLETALAAETQAEIDASYMDRVNTAHPILTVAEQIQALKAADLKIAAERKKHALLDLQKREEERLRGPIGQVTGDPTRDEPTWITLDLAEHQPWISINGTRFHHGQSYKVPRHVADTLREQQSRGWNHQLEIEGKGMAERFRRPQNQVLSGGERAA